jgi:hypothetical protein
VDCFNINPTDMSNTSLIEGAIEGAKPICQRDILGRGSLDNFGLGLDVVLEPKELDIEGDFFLKVETSEKREGKLEVDDQKMISGEEKEIGSEKFL